MWGSSSGSLGESSHLCASDCAEQMGRFRHLTHLIHVAAGSEAGQAFRAAATVTTSVWLMVGSQALARRSVGISTIYVPAHVFKCFLAVARLN